MTLLVEYSTCTLHYNNLCSSDMYDSHIEVSNIVLNLIFRSEPLRAQRSTIVRSIPYSKQDVWSAPSLKTRLDRFFCRLLLPDRINLSSHPCKSRAEVSSYA